MECYYFGTFDPVHLGHIKTANEICKKYNYDRVIFVPAYCPPHKNNITPANDRLNMLKLVEGGKIKVSDIEFHLETPSYSYKTVQKLIKNEKIHFIIGYDAFINIETWKNPDFLKENIRFLVLQRKGELRENIEKLKEKNYDFTIMDNIDTVDISSTEIREKISRSKSIENLVDKKVEEYIYGHNLYRTNS